tara:strand:- start:1973 stop:2626 length:654 start_codon:yes stop_codon:yes gene_type:complete
MGLDRGVLIMSDRETNSTWEHLTGKAINGPLKGTRLPIVPLPQLSWREWVNLHPETLVLDPKTNFAHRYRKVQIGQAHPSESVFGDDRLAPNSLVVGVEKNNMYAGFSLAALKLAGGVVNVEIGGHPVVVVYDENSNLGMAYSSYLSGRLLSFKSATRNGSLVLLDSTGNTWSVDGLALSGLLEGSRLKFIPSFVTEWYGWSAYHPDTLLFDDFPAQ